MTFAMSVAMNYSLSASNYTMATILVTGAYCSIGLLTLGGNLLVIVAVASTKRLQNVTNLYVLSLAVSDLLVSVGVLPMSVMVHLLQGQWPLGGALCIAWLSMDILLCTASILNLCCISLDRYFAITEPLVYATKRSKRRATLMIALVWLLSAAISLPPITGFVQHTLNQEECAISRDMGYRLYSAMGSFFLPFGIIIFVYVRIFIVAMKRKKTFQQTMSTSTISSSASNSNDNASTFRTSHHGCCCYRRDPPSAAKRSLRPHRGRKARSNPFPSSVIYQTGLLAVRTSLPHIILPNRTTLCKNSSEQISMVTEREISIPQPGIALPRHSSMLQRQILISGNLSDLVSLAMNLVMPRTAAGKFSRSKKNAGKKLECAAFRKEHKTAKTLGIVVGCFSICWLPFFVLYLVLGLCQSCAVPTSLDTAATWLGYINSAFNPFIYAFYNKEYAAAFRRLLLCRCNERRSKLRHLQAALGSGSSLKPT